MGELSFSYAQILPLLLSTRQCQSDRCDATPGETGFAKVVCDDFLVFIELGAQFAPATHGYGPNAMSNGWEPTFGTVVSTVSDAISITLTVVVLQLDTYTFV